MSTAQRESASYAEKIKKVDRVTNFKKWNGDGMLLRTFILITCIKLLLVPTYHSTDFEVHRNWLAITHNLPIKEWYVNAKSQWTLDYPPLFAWFEYCLSQIAAFVDAEMLKIENLNYASPLTVSFQRGTVMLTDLIFAYGVRETAKIFCNSHNSCIAFIFLSLCNVGLLLVDHVHFQYNGFLLGILLLSIARVSEIWKETSILQGAAWFCVLLNLKHIYLYVAPAYVVWLLKCYCMRNNQFYKRFFTLGIVVLIPLIISFGPFITQLQQLLSRLFPFKRGLMHAYWAANGWALYAAVDKIMSVVWKYFGWLKDVKTASMTGGLVQEQFFAVLPTPTPTVTFIITFFSMLPVLWSLFYKKASDPKYFVKSIVLCALCSFMFGWHVHEKAILTAILPLCVLAVIDAFDARIFLILSSAGHTALLPLLHPTNLTPLKLLASLLYLSLSIVILSKLLKDRLLRLYEWIYVGMLPLLTVYETFMHKVLFGDDLPFLPLAFTSVYCAIGVTYSWALYYYMYLHDRNYITDKENRYRKKEISVSKYKKRKINLDVNERARN